MNKGKKSKSLYSQGLSLGLPITSQMLLPLGLLGIGAENISTSVTVVILIVHKSILY